MSRKKNKTLNLKLNKITDNLVNVCNKILVRRENNCNCFDSNKYPTKDIKGCRKRNNNSYCRNYNKCKRIFTKFMTGT